MTLLAAIPHGTKNGYDHFKCRCSACREAVRIWSEAYYQRTRAEKVIKTAERRAIQRAYLIDAKLLTGCVDCGYRDHHEALDFDHVRGEKLFNISENSSRSLGVLALEIAKCDVVCANCHRVRTARQISERTVVSDHNRLRTKRRAWLSMLKVAFGCLDCGYDHHPDAIDLDHVTGTKEMNVCNILSYSWKRVLEEIAKCEVVCANCHRIRTSNRRRD